VRQRYEEKRRVMVVVSEGAVDKDGNILYEDKSNIDAFGHKKLGGCAQVVAARLKDALGKELKTRNFNAVIPGYLCRCGAPIPLDRDNAIALGKEAVKALDEGADGMMACLQRRGDEIVPTLVAFDALPQKPDGTLVPRRLDGRFYDPEAMWATPAGLEYLKPILGAMPEEPSAPILEVKKISP